MKYLEELSFGDCFSYNNGYYVMSSDFKQNGKKSCLSLETGFTHWFNGDIIVNITELYILDQNSNIIAIKQRSKNDNTQNQNIS
jgi:hypothetical protein